MNTTNRVLNRAFVLVIGLLALGLGTVAVALVAVPDFLRGWAQRAPSVTDALSTLLADTALAGTGTSWVPLAGLAAAALVVLALVLFIARQGRGRTHRLITAAPTRDGATIVDGAVAEQVLTADLQDRAEFDRGGRVHPRGARRAGPQGLGRRAAGRRRPRRHHGHRTLRTRPRQAPRRRDPGAGATERGSRLPSVPAARDCDHPRAPRLPPR